MQLQLLPDKDRRTQDRERVLQDKDNEIRHLWHALQQQDRRHEGPQFNYLAAIPDLPASDYDHSDDDEQQQRDYLQLGEAQGAFNYAYYRDLDTDVDSDYEAIDQDYLTELLLTLNSSTKRPLEEQRHYQRMPHKRAAINPEANSRYAFGRDQQHQPPQSAAADVAAAAAAEF